MTLRRWISGDAEKRLYSAITLRIEESLVKLQARALAELEALPDPMIKMRCDRAMMAMTHPPTGVKSRA